MVYTIVKVNEMFSPIDDRYVEVFSANSRKDAISIIDQDMEVMKVDKETRIDTVLKLNGRSRVCVKNVVNNDDEEVIYFIKISKNKRK